MPNEKITIGIPLFPDFDLLDVAGPVEVLGSMPNVEIFYISNQPSSIQSSPPMTIIPNRSFDHPERMNILLVPGGKGLSNALKNINYMRYLTMRGLEADYIVGVCAGSLLLAAAKLLDSHLATTHWNALSTLNLFPSIAVAGGYPRYVISGNRITSGGVSSGIDQALALVAMTRGEQAAKDIQLMLLYAPDPPYSCGTPHIADPVTHCRVSTNLEAHRKERFNLISDFLKPTP